MHGAGVSFIFGAGAGFFGGLVHRWRTDVREAKEAFREFPELMEHHLRQCEPSKLCSTSLKDWLQAMQCDPVRQGWAIAALYSASPAIQRIKEMQEEELISAAAAKYAAAATSQCGE